MSSLKDKIAAQRKAIADTKAAYQRAYKFKPGKTVLRILPAGTGTEINADEDFWVEYGAHYIKDPRDSYKLLAIVGDASITYGKPCPVRQAIVDYMDRCTDRGDETSAKAAKDWLARKVHVMNAVILGGPDTENVGKNVILELSESQYDAVLSVFETFVEDGDDPFDPNKGMVLICERTGTGVQDTKYQWSLFPKPEKAPATMAHLEGRTNLAGYRDGKFGQSVVKALGVMSNLLGYDVTATAIGAALATSAPTQALPAATKAEAPKEPETTIDDLLVDDAEFEDKKPAEAEASKAAPAAESDDLEDILAGLDDL